MNPNMLILFIHIPKTGGTSFTQNLQSNCPKLIYYYSMDAVKTSLAIADCFTGHFPYGFHQYTTRPYKYVTMLRDPVELTISMFYYMYKNRNPVLKTYDDKLSIEEFILSGKFDYYFMNLQSRYISGQLMTFVPDLKVAKSNLVNHIAFYGITELFAESQFLLVEEMGWKLEHYPKLNETPYRKRQSEISQQTIKAICEKSKVDILLYKFALEQMNKKMASLPPAQKKALQNYSQNK
ncbi:sulfotransferase family 2 domain-containing protein [Paenibacillus harenae]|uniref:sulfotransferase family 2 domain-containing protein n=1 Tax=Paenibacillus harenae TaxID=306543 RepID=UPI00278CEBCE|nr:sulfotransferase family 2 domain-containing protein [Paenibacillus harenae]MDQ0058840.1 hypothetical protein [Paenibacillus harenae]